MTEEKTCYNCGNKNCNVYYSMVKKDYKRHFETYEYNDFDCVNHDKWEELKMEEIHTDNTKTLQNALDRIAELEKENVELKEKNKSYEEIIESGSITLVKERLKNYKQFIKAKEKVSMSY